MSMRVEHGFDPVCDENSRVLVLGTMPSVKSREQGFYYGHPQNRFWKVIAAAAERVNAGRENGIACLRAGCGGGDCGRDRMGCDFDNYSGREIRVPQTIEEKRALLLSAGIAVWDVLAACEIEGSDDSSIRNPEPADIGMVLRSSPRIEKIICNGNAAYKLYLKFFAEEAARHKWPEAVKLPSTSPANAAWNLARLTDAWCAEIAVSAK